MNTSSFDAVIDINLNEYIKDIEPKISGFFKRILNFITRRKNTISSNIAQCVFEELVAETPVDTGFARANWVIDVFAVSSPELEYGPQYSSPTFPSWLRTNDKDWVISNFAHYIVYLNEGHSSQAAPGFVERAIHNGIQNAKLRSR